MGGDERRITSLAKRRVAQVGDVREFLDSGVDGSLVVDTSRGLLNWNSKIENWQGFSRLAAADKKCEPPRPAQLASIPYDVLYTKSSGTHWSDSIRHGDSIWVAMFGDGIWEWNGKTWSKPDLKLPDAAREITSLAQSKDGKTIWVGTRREGVWEYSGNRWKQHLQSDEPFAHNIQFLQKFGGALYASTLEDGLVIREAAGWKHLGKSTLSSNAPRQLVVFQNKLYVRHSNEVVDCFDGKSWKQNVFPALPRKQIISIASDANNLYLGQWGGWSAWDGKNFAHHLKIPELQIVPLMQIFPDGDQSKNSKLWLGTENRGLFMWNEDSQKLQHFDERDGLPDDWITSLNRSGSTLFAGTFKGGVAWLDEKSAAKKPRWQTALKGSGVTSIVVERDGSTLVGTHFDLYQRDEKGKFISLSNWMQGNDREIQAMLSTDEGLWIGTRNSLLFRTNESMKRSEETAKIGF